MRIGQDRSLLWDSSEAVLKVVWLGMVGDLLGQAGGWIDDNKQRVMVRGYIASVIRFLTILSSIKQNNSETKRGEH
ncbi:hypothetical protein GCM10010912_66640 [Paenibacillus albidus]|uniref:Uncharacterized protein n=1 Tax=Paenibacillus albidus TaxID=2041023 RepID=A0A917D6N8_9BACL|nr:hypothetical protein GCM10010912_66640 [Paenibacillus albidus]